MKSLKKEFKSYYTKNLKLDENDKNSFFNILLEPLPCVFRLNKQKIKYIKEYELKLFELAKENNLELKKIEISNIDFFKNNIFELDIARMKLKKNEKYDLIHKFLDDGVNNGLISRQELVSMMPPMLLDCIPGEKVLDMCASPGSKTAQIIESVDRGENNPFSLVIANDNSANRVNTLHHQLKRLGKDFYIITQLNAEEFPTNIYSTEDKFFFDKILCDVPCSGDAVVRKYPEQLDKWNTLNGIKLHKLQLAILLRGAQILDTKGTLVYSTCSLNPIENEAVISEFLIQTNYNLNCKYEYIIENCKDLIYKDLKYRQGLTEWDLLIENSILSKNLADEFDEFKEVLLSDFENESIKKLIPISCLCYKFRNLDIEVNEHIKSQLVNTIRIYPHDNNSSGFFMCKITKKLKSEDSKYLNSKIKEKTCNKNYSSPYIKDQLVSVSSYKSNDFLLNWIKNFYGLSDEFDMSRLITKSECPRKIYITNSGCASLLKTKNSKLRTFASGIRLLEVTSYNILSKEETDEVKINEDVKVRMKQFRLCNEGINLILPYMKKRVIKISNQKLFNLFLLGKQIHLESLEDEFEIKLFTELTSGCFVIVLLTEINQDYLSCIKSGNTIFPQISSMNTNIEELSLN